MEKKPQESEDPEAKAWYERYVKAQPNEPLKTTDYHYVQIMSRWREDQTVLDRKKEDAAKAAEANGKKQKRRKRFILF
jgi:heme-degrading monooxygenase HmoA